MKQIQTIQSSLPLFHLFIIVVVVDMAGYGYPLGVISSLILELSAVVCCLLVKGKGEGRIGLHGGPVGQGVETAFKGPTHSDRQ